jgi:hypothetical protein
MSAAAPAVPFWNRLPISCWLAQGVVIIAWGVVYNAARIALHERARELAGLPLRRRISIRYPART